MTQKKQDSYDYLIVGAGPAGLQLGYYLEKAGHNYLILEEGESPGTFFKSFPRHRTLISSNKIYTGYDDAEINLRWDWNSLLCDSDKLLFKEYSKNYFPRADDLVAYLKDYAAHYNLKIRYETKVTKITKDSIFRVRDMDGGEYLSKRLIVATGFCKPYSPAIPGIELTENYMDVSVNKEDFINKCVLVLGKGNSGFETAENLIETAAVIHVLSPNPINMAWKTHFVGHLRAVNNNLLDTYQLKSQNAIIDATVEKIEQRNGKFVVSVSYSHANGEREDLYYDRVISCTGFRFDNTIFDESCRPAMAINDRFPAQTCQWESVNIPELYFAGTLMQQRDFKKTTSGFIHGFRYNIRSLYRIFETKYHNGSWPRLRIDATPDILTNTVIERINKSSALWQQFGFLCDLLVISPDGTQAYYYEELPVSYIPQSGLSQSGHHYRITLEFGHITGDPFNITRQPDPNRAGESTFLHPIIRRFANNTQVSEIHLLEDLAGEWMKPDMHIKPLLEYFAQPD